MKKLILIFMLIMGTSLAQTPLAEDEIETRAREVGRALRCVICQNQSIEESDATLAEDMRTLVRARIRAGDSNEDVIAYMQNRYGDFVLLKPPVQANTYVLWLAPFILIYLGGVWFVRRSRQSFEAAPQALTVEELSALSDLINKHEKTRQ